MFESSEVIKKMEAFYATLRRLPADDRQDFYDDNIDIVREYLKSIGVDKAYFEMVAVNETIREKILEYVMNNKILFREDGIYDLKEGKKIFGVIRADDIVEYANSHSTSLGSNAALVSEKVVPLISGSITKGIEFPGKFWEKKQRPNILHLSGDFLFIGFNTFIAMEKPKEEKEKEAKSVGRIAMVEMGPFGNKCHIKLVNPRGIVYFEDDRQVGGGGALTFKNWAQRIYHYRDEDSHHKPIIKKVSIDVTKKKQVEILEEDGDPLSLDSYSWKYKKPHLITFFEKYPKFEEWFYDRFKDPMSLLDRIYKEQEESFKIDLENHQTRIGDEVAKKESVLADLDMTVRAIIHNINSTRIAPLKVYKINAFKDSLREQVQKIFLLSDQKAIKEIIQSSIDKAIAGEAGFDESNIDAGEEEEKFKKSKEAYAKIKQSDCSEKEKVKQIIKKLYERHRLIRRISHVTPKDSTYDQASNSLRNDINLIQQASSIINKAVEDVLLLSADPSSVQVQEDNPTPIDLGEGNDLDIFREE